MTNTILILFCFFLHSCIFFYFSLINIYGFVRVVKLMSLRFVIEDDEFHEYSTVN